MRHLKFRAWDIDGKMMSDGLPFNWFITGENTDMEFHKVNGSLPLSDFRKYLQDFIIMQFTGLKDKNGKEIYEGDILGRLFDSHEGNCEVIYRGAICCARNIQSGQCRPLNILKDYSGAGWIAADSVNPNYNFEVMGNIYENPNLV